MTQKYPVNLLRTHGRDTALRVGEETIVPRRVRIVKLRKLPVHVEHHDAGIIGHAPTDGTLPSHFKKIIRLKALLPDNGCRSLALLFNRRFADRSMTVGKTFVSHVIRRHRYEIHIARQTIQHAPPKPVPLNHVWGLDLTGKTDEHSRQHSLLGILEHHSRACLTLTALKDKTAVTVLRCLLHAIERFGKPAILRTDNEAVFTSKLFRFGLRVLGIQHRRSDLGCPWQNGRIERFFGTLKQKLNLWSVDNRLQLNLALSQFCFWYNHVRLHQNLGGRTPAEAWNAINVSTARVRQEFGFEGWDGLLRGIYLKL